jgi:hypothetical protein
MKPPYSLLIVALLAGCAGGRQLVAEGRLPDGETYRDYSTQPFGFAIERETYGPDGAVRDRRNLLSEDNFKNLHPGMTPEEVVAVVGPSPQSEQRSYAGGTKSWSYRYRDVGVIKLLHVIYGADDRLQSWYTEWDPRVYSKGGNGRDGHGGR